MSHHVAELISKADQAKDGDAKQTAQRQAIDAILLLWNNRMTVDTRLNPFYEFKTAVSVLQSLKKVENAWIARNDALARTYNGLRRLILSMAFRQVQSLNAAAGETKKAQRTSKWQSEDERAFADIIHTWLTQEEIAEAAKAAAAAAAEGDGTASTDKPVDFIAIAKAVIPDIRASLDQLESEISRLQNADTHVGRKRTLKRKGARKK